MIEKTRLSATFTATKNTTEPELALGGRDQGGAGAGVSKCVCVWGGCLLHSQTDEVKIWRYKSHR